MERLWEEFKLKASADARERLILHYAPLVKYVAGRAIEKYDLERGIKFETYAISRVKGAIEDPVAVLSPRR